MENPTLPERLRGQAPTPQRIARGLGWFSIALGAAQLVMPRTMARACGMKDGATAMRLYGLREIACGIGILQSRNATPWLWARVAGDVMDASTLAAEADLTSSQARRRTGVALANVAAITALDVYTARTWEPAPLRPGVDFPDYRDRSGLPRSPDEMRGAALSTFVMPRDMRGPESLRPWTSARDGGQTDDVPVEAVLPVGGPSAPDEENRQLARGDFS
jgi:hypothetical protein